MGCGSSSSPLSVAVRASPRASPLPRLSDESPQPQPQPPEPAAPPPPLPPQPAPQPPPPPAAHPLVAAPPPQADGRARLFLSVLGVVVAHDRGALALDCWPCQYLCRETRFVKSATQRGTLADLLRGGLASSGVARQLAEARSRRREEWCAGIEGSTQLMRAAADNDLARVRRLFLLGCPGVDAHDAQRRTALNEASACGHEAIVRELLAHGADVNREDNSGWTPLIAASSNGHAGVARHLCDAPGVDLSARDAILSATALGYALQNGHAEIVALLQARGAPP